MAFILAPGPPPEIITRKCKDANLFAPRSGLQERRLAGCVCSFKMRLVER